MNNKIIQQNSVVSIILPENAGVIRMPHPTETGIITREVEQHYDNSCKLLFMAFRSLFIFSHKTNQLKAVGDNLTDLARIVHNKLPPIRHLIEKTLEAIDLEVGKNFATRESYVAGLMFGFNILSAVHERLYQSQTEKDIKNAQTNSITNNTGDGSTGVNEPSNGLTGKTGGLLKDNGSVSDEKAIPPAETDNASTD